LVVALDGPAAAGKGTLARRLAKHYELAYLDTGALYRVVALALLRQAADPADAAAAAAAARALDPGLLADPALRDEATGQAASVVAAIPAVRRALLDWQRDFAARLPVDKKGTILDGRDIGTVVCPDARIKFFITASLEARARRRFKELMEKETLQDRAQGAIYAQILQDMQARDARDEARAAAPMKPAADAKVIDTSSLNADQVFDLAKNYIDQSLRAAL